MAKRPQVRDGSPLADLQPASSEIGDVASARMPGARAGGTAAADGTAPAPAPASTCGGAAGAAPVGAEVARAPSRNADHRRHRCRRLRIGEPWCRMLPARTTASPGCWATASRPTPRSGAFPICRSGAFPICRSGCAGPTGSASRGFTSRAAVAMVLSMIVLIAASDAVAAFFEVHPTVKFLALGFLIMIGMALVADGFGAHVPRATSTAPWRSQCSSSASTWPSAGAAPSRSTCAILTDPSTRSQWVIATLLSRPACPKAGTWAWRAEAHPTVTNEAPRRNGRRC